MRRQQNERKEIHSLAEERFSNSVITIYALVLDRKCLSVSNKKNGAFYHIFSTSSKLDSFSIIKLITFPLSHLWDFNVQSNIHINHSRSAVLSLRFNISQGNQGGLEIFFCNFISSDFVPVFDNIYLSNLQKIQKIFVFFLYLF